MIDSQGLEVVLVGESAVVDEGCDYADEGEEVFGLALVAAVESSAAGLPPRLCARPPSGGGPAAVRTRRPCVRFGGGCLCHGATGAGGRNRTPCCPETTSFWS
jgi:hypothetical protein